MKKIVKIIVTVVIIYSVFNAVTNFVSKAKDKVENTISSITNNYVENHTTSYEINTDSDNLTTQVKSGVRDKYTKLLGNGNDEVTVMVYMIGTDLESSYGMATSDIYEMLYGKTSDNINLIIETGGCKKWNNSTFANGQVERWTINSSNFLRLNSPGKVAMTDPNELTDFIRYAKENFPANRYILILWDHGGGSETGYGYDENYPYNSSMTPDDIGLALKNSGVKFDIVGFDACLMANLETAVAIEPYADYLIASEESEPGEGWYYTNWIKMLEENTSTPSLTLGKQIIDDYISTSRSNDMTAEITQSITDLGELVYNIKEPLNKFSNSTIEKLNGSQYQSVATARSNTKEFSKSSNLDQVDLVDLVTKFDVEGSNELVNAIKSAIKYNKTYNINNAYGLSVYFPYTALSKVNSMIEIYDNINMDEEYSGMIKSFATYVSSGQISTHNYNSYNSSLFDILNNDDYNYNSSYSQDDYYDMFHDSYYNNYDGYGYQDSFGQGYENWMDTSMLDVISAFFRNNSTLNPSILKISEKNNQRVVSLSNQEWDQIDNVTLNLFVDDGQGYLDLGKDNIFDWNDEGDLIVDHDGTWLAINQTNVVCYEFVSDMYIDENNYKTVGYIPAYLNNERVNLVINFTPENPYGIILGGQLLYEDSDIKAKGLIQINNGDEIRFVCNYYKYDGTLVDEFEIGEPLIVNGELELSNVYLDNNYVYSYCFTDIYGNKMWTPKTNK